MAEYRDSQDGSAEGEQAIAPELGRIDPQELVRAAAELARERPHTALACACAVGFLLGGGLTPRLLTSLALILGRRYAAEAARAALGAALQQQLDDAPPV